MLRRKQHQEPGLPAAPEDEDGNGHCSVELGLESEKHRPILPQTTASQSTAFSLPPTVYSFGCLTTGTLLAVLGQVVINQGATDPTSHLVAWTKYFCTFVLSLVLAQARPQAKGVISSQRNTRKNLLILAIGCTDVAAYGLSCIGFPKCGSALSMVVFAASGQIFTALARLLILRKSMNKGQLAAVLVVIVGLVIRSLGAFPQRSATQLSWRELLATADFNVVQGVALVAASALGYSLLGVLYEWLVVVAGPSLSHTEVSSMTSAFGLAAATVYQFVYTRPRWDELVAARMVAKKLQPQDVLQLFALFGVLVTVHTMVQARVLAKSGAMALGIVNALRAAVVSVASAAMFCSPASPNQCLTLYSGTSAAVVSTGALLWTLAGRAEKFGKPKDKAS